MNTGEKIPIEGMKICAQLIAGIEQGIFIRKQEGTAVYSIKNESSYTETCVNYNMTLQEVFNMAVCRSAASVT